MKIRFYNCRILAMDGSAEIGEGEVWVDGRCISYVGKGKGSAQAFDREVDVQGNLIMPGFKNAHTPMTCPCSSGWRIRYSRWRQNSRERICISWRKWRSWNI